MTATPTKIDLPRGPLIAGGFALVTVLGSTQTWARVLFVSVAGTDADRGVITLLAALGAVVMCAARLLFGARDRWYFGAGVILGAIAVSMPMWFFVDIVNEPDDDTFGNLIAPSWGLFLTIAAAIGYEASLAWQLVTRRKPGAVTLASDAG